MMFLALLAIASIVEGTPDDICGQTFTVLSGQTQTVDYLFADGNYPGNSNCVFHLKATGSNGMRIRFTELDIEKHARCSFDYLQIFDGSTTSSSSLGKLCGYVVPDPVESNSNFVTLKFVSDRTVHKSGFILQFSTKTEEQFVGSCSPTLTTQTGTLSSPYFPNNYPNRVNCTYEIAPATGNQILIQFPTFQLERSTGCVMDYVTISSRTQPISGKICGDLDGYGYLVPGSHAVLNFVSDRSSTRRGFQVSYKVVDTCKELDNICLDGCTVDEDNFLQCTCKPGFGSKKGETQCHDVDECRISNGGCADQCTNTEGSFQCACTRSGFFLSPDGFNCTDRSCSVDNAGCEHNCHVSGTGGYFCTCNPGYLVTGNGHECTDIDECTNPKYQHACEQKCNNEPGSYFCDCQSGYQLSANRRTCNDVDECLTQGDNCEHECHNYPGGWSCSCYPGYQANPSYTYGCIDINECLPEHIPDHCDECLNFQGGFSCTTCSPGFVANENQTLCLDTNECADNNGGCQQMCINSPGSYSCQCHSGQELVDGSTNGECKDINECAPNNGRGPCEHYCENSVGAFQCHCLDGFSMQPGSGTVCQDIDECATENGGCQQQCNNAQGAFSCSCFTGYYMIEGSCTDIDECLEYKPCDLALPKRTSHFYDDTMSRLIELRFAPPGKSDLPHHWPRATSVYVPPKSSLFQGAKCVNSPGSFQCICPKGYDVVNNTKCLDVDECANGTYGTSHGCPQQCVNTPGSYHCKCHSGFVDVGNNSCVDLNECSNSPCQHKDLCTNTVGSFQCACPPGYYLLGDGISCSDVDECAGDEIRCEQICINEIGDYKCACNDGFELNSDNYTCADINECLRNTSGCSDGCVNTRGGYRCYCHQGYGFSAANNQTCYDTDECTVNNGGCDHVCTNNPGSFSCGCQDGYRVAGNRCHDIDECSMNNGNCSQKCNNLNGTYACECAPDFKLGDDSRTCGHCPTCEAFEQVVSDVEQMKPNTAIVQQLTTANMQLSAKIALLESRLEQLQNRINTIEQSQGR